MKRYNFKSYLTLIIFCLLLCVNTNAQQGAQPEAITTDDGLSQGMIYDILQDKEGFLWIATKDGLNRYDGYEFKVFTNDPNDPWSISGNTIIKLFEDSAGRIWAASDNAGLSIYDKKTGRFHHLRHDPSNPASLSGNYISAIVEDTSGYFITAVDKQEINVFRLEDEFFSAQKAPQFIRLTISPQRGANKVNQNGFSRDSYNLRGIVKDTKDRIWVGGSNAIYQLNVQKAELTLAVDGYSFENAHASPDGSIWAGGGTHKLFHWDGIKPRTFEGDQKEARDIWQDERENLWVASIDSLYGIRVAGRNGKAPLGLLSDHNFYSWKPSGKDFPFISLIADRSGIVWVGTTGFGLYKINPQHKAFSHYLSGVSIRKIVQGPESKLLLQNYAFEWFNTDGPLLELNRLRNEEPNLDAFLVAKSGEIWKRLEYVDQQHLKIKRFNPQTKESQSYDISWHHSQLQPMIECRDGTIWMAGFNGVLSCIDPQTDDVISYDLKDGKSVYIKKEEKPKPSLDYSTALFEDKDGILWVGTERGFTKCIRPSDPMEALQMTTYKNIPGDQNSLSYNHVTSFLEDPINPNSFLWVCTKGGGINIFDKDSGTFKKLTKKDGLPDDVVYGILTDDYDNIWGSTNKGLFCMIPKKDEDGGDQWNYTIRNFTSANGLQGNEFNTGAYKKLPDGRLVFGGVNGYNIFNPKEILSGDFIPPTYITNILVNNQPVVPGDDSGILGNTIETTSEITLSYLDKILTLEFSSLDFTAPNHNNYRYQLVGTDDTWVDAGNRRSATFLNLQPDDYTFRVQGSNSQGIWSDKIAQLKIIVLPPWWRTWWAYIVYGLFAAFLLMRYYEFITKRTKLNQQLVFEKSEADKAKELDHLKTRLYTNLTHEFRTPLTIIIGMVDQIKSSSERNRNEGLDMIKRNGENLLQLINRMLDLSKIESGKMVLNARQGDIIQTFKNVSDSFVRYASNKDITIHFLSDLDQKHMIYDNEKVRHILSNLISNALKFTLAGGNVYISVRQQENNIVLKVKDTGKGISSEHQSMIFDRFYQVESADNRPSEGTGIGLALCKELTFLMHGEVSVQSPPPGSSVGSEFTVILPIADVARDISRRAQVLPDYTKKSAALFEPKPTENVTSFHIDKASNKAVVEDEKVILLVEDNADIVAYVAAYLQDYKLIVATNGSEGLEMAIDAIPDLIVSDVMMPIMDGFEMCKRIKQDARTNHIPVVILTAKADIGSKIEGLEYGANAYIPKPFDKVELILTIRNLFNLRKQLQKHYRVGSIENDVEVSDDLLNPEIAPKLDDFVLKVRKKIEARIDDFGLSVEDLAKELHFSQSQFSRKLNALIGMTPLKYIRQLRLEKAKTLLADPELSITVISYECGFSDPNYFTRVFRKELGKAPAEWRMEG